MADEWPPARARSLEDWAAYWARQRRDRRFRHDVINPKVRRMKQRLKAPAGWWQRARRLVQRARRGWADSDVWGLDDYLCRVTGQAVAHLRDISHGYPCTCEHAPGPDGIYVAPDTCTCQADYETMLTQISEPLLAYNDVFDSYDRHVEIIAAAQSAFRLLAENLPVLWD